jgi:hypothetical protein
MRISAFCFVVPQKLIYTTLFAFLVIRLAVSLRECTEQQEAEEQEEVVVEEEAKQDEE